MAKKADKKAIPVKKAPVKKKVEKTEEPVTEAVNNTAPESETTEPPKKDPRGRAKKDFLDSFQFKGIDEYYNQNKLSVEEEKKSTESTGQSTTTETTQPGPVAQVEEPKEKVLIEITPDKLELVESVLDAITLKIINTFGFSMEIEPMSEKELKVMAQLTPPIELERSWKNAILYYLLIKLTK